MFLQHNLLLQRYLSEILNVCIAVVIGSSSAIVALIAATSAWSQAPSRLEPSREASGRSSSRADTDVVSLFRFEPTGLSLLRPYQRGKTPVVFVHGLWVGPWSWSRMIESLEADAALRDRYQLWTFGYSTGDPIPYSAALLRRDLVEVRRKFDPDGTDAAFERMVLVGHSMGGLLTKMMVQDSGTRLWRLISNRPADELAGEPEDRDLFRSALIFKPCPEVRRVLFIATPHRGSRVDRGGLKRLGSRLIRLADPLRASHERSVGPQWPGLLRETLPQGPAHQHRRTGVAIADPHVPERGSDSRRRSRPIPSSRTGATRPGPEVATAWSRTRVRIWKGRCPSRSCRPAICVKTIPPLSARSGGSSRSMGPPEEHVAVE